MGNDNIYSEIFVEPDEHYIGALGDSYLNSFLTTQKIKQCIAVLSDKRVYLRGNMIDTNNGKISHINVRKTIDLEDITGTGFAYSRQLWLIIVGIIMIIGGFYTWLFRQLLGVPFLLLGVICIVAYLKSRTTLFLIEYAGGCIKFDAAIYGLAKSQDFEKQIRRAKNRLKNNR